MGSVREAGQGLACICKDGIDSIGGGIRELEAHGYLIRARVRNENGQLGSIEYTILEQSKEHWAYWSRYICINRYMDAPEPVYDAILKLVQDKDYFVITTNVDHCFQKAGFDKKRLFYTQGDYGLFQCSEPCCQETFENEAVIREMVTRQENMKIPSELLPVCPHCGKTMTMNLRSDNKFVENKGWHKAEESYENFLRTREEQKILFLELGVGYNTPVIIKYPFWQMTAKNPDATYICINQGQAVCPQEIKKQSICMDADIGQVLHSLSVAAIQ